MKNLQTSNKMIKGNQRVNGYLKLSSSDCGSNLLRSKLYEDYYASRDGLEHGLLNDNASNSFESVAETYHETKFAANNDEHNDEDFESKITIHSIIGFNNEEGSVPKIQPNVKLRTKKGNFRSTHHETLQRIESLNEDQFNHYQKHWFSAGLERLKLEDRSREERLEITRYELRRHLKQLIRCNVGRDARLPPLCDWEVVIGRSTTTATTVPSSSSASDRLVVPRNCDVAECGRPALPCARHCTLHIMHNQDQVLFSYCTAKFADNTQCSVPVFDIQHELPLCVEHARKRDNYKMYQEAKPKKLRKKVKPSAMIRPQKRNKKKKKPSANGGTSVVRTHDVSGCSIIESSEISDEIMTDVPDDSEDLGEDMVEQVLALQEPDALELANVDQVLVTQASHLLEETDITNVLSTIQADEFNDFFTVNRNGEYEPTREETEELERALAAVDNDVKSLEKLSQSQGLLDTFLDDHNLVESLVQSSIVPDVFHNGFGTCGENMMVGQTSRLLSVQPHSHT